jgi:hypothetical protein
LTPSNLDIFTIILIMFAFQDPTQKQQWTICDTTPGIDPYRDPQVLHKKGN